MHDCFSIQVTSFHYSHYICKKIILLYCILFHMFGLSSFIRHITHISKYALPFFIRNNKDVRLQLSESVQNYFDSTITKKGNIEFLCSTNGNENDIYLNHNDYLNLSFDHRLIHLNGNNETSLRDKQGSDNLMSGTFLHEDCFQYRVANLLAEKVLNKESIYLTQSGYLANYSLLQSIVVPGKTHVYMDNSAHESLWQGANRGIIHRIKHNSLEHLEENLKKYGSGIIVIDSLYSSRGSIAHLSEICQLKEKYSCLLVVDESHSIGIYGDHGRGLAALTNVTDKIDFITGSLAKAYCVRAGFIAGPTKHVLYVRETSSAAIFSSTLMNSDLQRLRRVIDIIYHADQQRQTLLNISKIIRQAAIDLRFKIEKPIYPSPIISIIGGPYHLTKNLQAIFENHRIAPAIFIPPATPVNQSILRLTLHANLSHQDINTIIKTFEFIAQRRKDFLYTFQS